MAGRNYPRPVGGIDAQYILKLINELDDRDARTPEVPINPDRVTITNFTESRSIDASSATLQQTKDFLLTVVKDLIDAGVVDGNVS